MIINHRVHDTELYAVTLIDQSVLSPCRWFSPHRPYFDLIKKDTTAFKKKQDKESVAMLAATVSGTVVF